MQLAHKTPCLLPQMFVKDTELKKRFPSLSFLPQSPCAAPFISVQCQTAPLVRYGTEIKCYCPAVLSDDNTLHRCQGREVGCLLFKKLFLQLVGPLHFSVEPFLLWEEL